MKTDELFYELFRLDPRSLFQLVQLKLEGVFAFESITVKSTEKRFDGFLKRIDGKGPNIFLEVQGYYDPVIYWRLFREFCMWYEQSMSNEPFVAIVLFLNKKYDPGECTHFSVPPHKLIRANLDDCLKSIGDKESPLTILKPIVLSEKGELHEHVRQWKKEIDSLQLPENKNKVLVELLEYAILQRFPELTLKEIQKMVQLTPLEETVAVKELIQQSFKQGTQDGIKKGKIIGKIHMAQRLLKRPITPEEELESLTIGELKTILAQLVPGSA